MDGARGCFFFYFSFDDNIEEVIKYMLLCRKSKRNIIKLFSKERIVHVRQHVDINLWINDYTELTFYQLFRLKKETFQSLLRVLLEHDEQQLIKKKYRGGNYPVQPEKSLLVFLWYLSKQDTLLAIADRFDLVPSTIMQIVNVFLYILNSLKNHYIFWPKTEEEFTHVLNGFSRYPGVIGAIDGTHINLKVPLAQHDSYVNRHQQHSINLMAICSADKIFTYIFVGFPGSAHDSRVFSNSPMFQHIATHGKNKYFPQDFHLIGDSAFPLRTWLMTPFKHQNNFTRIQRNHNFLLSSNRICIENTFGILKGRFTRLRYINTYSISKAVEIIMSACILHNFCYMQNDQWTEELFQDDNDVYEDFPENDHQQHLLGKTKRLNIANNLLVH